MSSEKILEKPDRNRMKYPRYGADFADLGRCIEKFVLPGCLPAAPLIGPRTRVRAQGSCFATNLAAALKVAGVAVGTIEFQEAFNTPRHNADYLAKVLRERGSEYEALRVEEVFILTLGVAAGPLAGNADALAEVVNTLRSINPHIAIVLTVSPVPLNSVAGGGSAVLADCVSKSTLRVVADDFMRLGIEGVYYWPSFEIVRWLGAHIGPVYGADDDLHRHVNLSMIDLIVKLFLKYYSTLTPA
jgi:hypothetical protein